MNKMLYVCLATLALAVACGGGNDKDTPKQDLGAEVSGDVVTKDQAGDDLAADSVGDTAPEDALPDVGPGGPVPTPELVAHFCDVYCGFVEGCTGDAPVESCKDDCAAQAEADNTFAVLLTCANALYDDDGEEAYCGYLETCEAGFELLPACETLCNKLDKCEAIGNDAFGYSLVDCQLVCSAFATFDEKAADSLDCLDGALEACSGIEFFSCMEDEQPACDQTICEEGYAVECGHVPAVYDTAAACAQTCTDWSAGQNMAAESCMNMTAEWPLPCADRAEACLGVPDQLPEGAADYCSVINEKCNFLGFQLGKLTDEICAWQLTGITTALPELFVPFAQAAQCLDALDVCPPGEGGFLICLVNAPEDAVAACATIAEVCQPADFAGEMELTCRMMTAFGEAVFPEMVADIVNCLNNGQTCDDKMACFPEDEE